MSNTARHDCESTNWYMDHLEFSAFSVKSTDHFNQNFVQVPGDVVSNSKFRGVISIQGRELRPVGITRIIPNEGCTLPALVLKHDFEGGKLLRRLICRSSHISPIIILTAHRRV